MDSCKLLLYIYLYQIHFIHQSNYMIGLYNLTILYYYQYNKILMMLMKSLITPRINNISTYRKYFTKRIRDVLSYNLRSRGNWVHMMPIYAKNEYPSSLPFNFDLRYKNKTVMEFSKSLLKKLLKRNVNDIDLMISKIDMFPYFQNIDTYNIVLLAYAMQNNLSKCEEYYKYILNNYYPDPNTFHAMILIYSKSGRTTDALGILDTMKILDLGLQPSIYTLLILAYERENQLDKCWNVFCRAKYEKCYDKYLLRHMLRICEEMDDLAKLYDVWQDYTSIAKRIKVKEFNYIFKLFTRPLYDYELSQFANIIEWNHVKSNEKTYIYLIRAASTSYKETLLNETLKKMEEKKIPLSKQHYVEIMKAYTKLCTSYYDKKTLEKYDSEIWKIYEKLNQQEQVDVDVLNALVEFNCKLYRIDVLNEKVLPLFEIHSISMNEDTYSSVMMMSYLLYRDSVVLDIYEAVKSKIRMNEIILNLVVDSSISLDRYDSVKECLYLNKKFGFNFGEQTSYKIYCYLISKKLDWQEIINYLK
jgi:hypothetical protein